MKTTFRRFSGALLALGWMVSCFGAPSPKADPLVKNPAVAATEAGQAKSEPKTNCQVTVEVYSVGRADAVALLAADPADAPRYGRVRELAKSQKARLEILMAVSARSGNHTVVNAIDEVRYPTEFASPKLRNRNSIAWPMMWETRNVGDTLDVTATLAQNNQDYSLDISLERVLLGEFRDVGGASEFMPVSQPIFHTQKLTTGIHGTSGSAQYLGTFSTPSSANIAGDAATEELLAFVRLDVVGSAEKLESPPAGWKDVGLDYLCYSLDRDAARNVLANATSFQAPWKDLQPLLTNGKARLETAASVRGPSGMRTIVQSVREFHYPTTFNLPQVRVSSPSSEAKGSELIPGSPSRIETRNLGFEVECEPVVAPDGESIEVNQSPRLTTFFGNLAVTGVAKDYPPQPVFAVQQMTSQMTIIPGDPVLAGTFTPPGADGVNGRVDSGRTWLMFVRGSLVSP